MTDTSRTPIDEPNVWTPESFSGRAEWSHPLSDAMIAEIEQATRAVKARGLAWQEISKADFPLPRTAALLEEAYDDLENGRGFTVVTGWPVERFGYEDNVTAYCGIGAHLGRIKIQNYEGDWLTDVRDEGRAYSHEQRGYHSNKLLPFHTDGADVVGLLCLGEPAEGGRSLLVSATKVFNTVLAERPDLIPLLERGFYHHRRRQHAEGENPISAARVPVFEFEGGYLHCCYNRNPIDWVEKEGIALTAAEKECLDFFDKVVARPELQIDMGIHSGDMQFVNNFVILHSRTGYRDDAEHRRHLVRLWLEDPHGKRMGQSLLDLYVPGTSRYAAAHA